jgi:ppGpp synthetase/RelA/SpoT-type nucleotidyltranferase
MAEFSKRQVEKLGKRLRDAAAPSPEDLALLEELLLVYDDALAEVATRRRSIGLEPTTRLKTFSTTLEKLRRPPYLSLATIQDLAGARIVMSMTLDEQDAVVAKIQELFPGCRLVDRRVKPSHG